MASTLVVVRLLAILLLGIQFVFGNTYDWDTVKDVLSDEIFDLKAKNKQLESRIDKMESLMQTRAPISYPSGKTGTARIETMEKRISVMETKMSENTPFSRSPLKLKSIVINALRSEKKERLKSELEIAAGLRKINDSLDAFNVQSDAVFASQMNKISDRIEFIKKELLQNISVIENEVTAVSNNATMLASQTNLLIESKIRALEVSIDTTNHDVSKMNTNLNTAIDNVKTDLSHNISEVRNEVTDVRNNVTNLANQTHLLIERKIRALEVSIETSNHDVLKMNISFNAAKDIVKTELSHNISEVRNEATDASNNVINLANRTNLLIESKIRAMEVSIDTTNHDVSKMNTNLNNAIDIVKTDLSYNISDVRIEVTAVGNNVAKLATQTNLLLVNKITTLEMSIDATKHNVLKMGVDLNSVIDIVLLNHTVACEPNCVNDGVCFRNNVCKCKPFTEGPRCEKVLCDNKCNVNGGRCIGPGDCACPEGKFGNNCEQEGCLLPEDAAKYKDNQDNRTIFKPGETLTAFSCPVGFILSSRDGMTCQDGVWSNIVKCNEAAVYLISVKTGKVRYSGTDAKVFITLRGLKGSTDRIYLQGSFEPDDLDETRVQAKDVRPITSVVIGHDGSGIGPDWYLEYVSIGVENMEEYYVFRHNDWVKA